MKKLAIFFLVLISFVPAIVAQPNEARDTLTMDNLLSLSFDDLMNVSVVTATQNSLKSGQAPATVMVVTSEQIRLRGYRTLAEVLNDLPDFTVHDKSDPQYYNRVSLRGVPRQDYFVILLDGVRISSPTNEPLPLVENFPIYLARQIEVVYGPGSALYGADAMGGVINIITSQPDLKSEPFSLTAQGGSHALASGSLLFRDRLKNDFGLTIAGSYTYDNQPDFSKVYEDDFNMESHRTGVFNTTVGTLTPEFKPDPSFASPVKSYNIYTAIEKAGFHMKILHHYAAVPTSTTLGTNNAVYNKDVFYGHGVTVANAGYSAEVGKLRSVSSLTASFYSVDPQSNYRNLYSNMDYGYKFSTGSMMKVEQQMHYSPGKNIDLIGGLTHELFQSIPKTPELESPVDRKNAATGILLNSVAEYNPSGIPLQLFPVVYSNTGSYLQVQYFALKNLSFTSGVRFDYNSRFGSTTNPRLGVVFHPAAKTTVKAMFGTAFWAPSPMITFEQYGSFYTTDSGLSYRSSFLHLPNPDLEPITSKTFEVSIEQKVGSRSMIRLTAFNTKTDNLIRDVSDVGSTNLYNNRFLGWPVDYIEVPVNEGHQHNFGGSLLMHNTFRFGKLELMAYSSVSYLQGYLSPADTRHDNLEQSAITPWQYRIGIDGKSKAFHFSARLLHTGAQKMTKFKTGDNLHRETLPGYTVLNISTGVTVRSSTTIFATVQNALDQRYMTALTWDSTDFPGAPQNPMRMTLGVRVGL